MKKLALRIAAVVSPVVALAAGDTGTGDVAQMQVSGKQFGMMIGGLVVMGLMIWLVSKLTGGSSKKKE